MDDTATQLDAARRSGDQEALAEALTHHANTLVKAAQIGAARQALDEAAGIHRRAGRRYDEARCTHMAATLCRLEGDLAGAKARALRAGELAEPDSPVAVSVATELAETAMAAGDAAAAVAGFGRALEQGRRAGLTEAAQAALLRKRGNALVMTGDPAGAVRDLERAHALLLQAGDNAAATRSLIEAASALQQSGDSAGANDLIERVIAEARSFNDDHALADVFLLRSTQAVERRDVGAALEAARVAQTHALAARAPVSYIAAAAAISELADAAGDRRAAYEALAAGWVTLGDLLGRPAAKAAFEPRLQALRQRWGAEPFAAVKAAYEASRKAELGL